MPKDDAMKRLGVLEKQASDQERLIEDIKTNLSEEKKKYEAIIAEMRGIIRDERNGQEGMQFPPDAAEGKGDGKREKEAPVTGAITDGHLKGKRLTNKVLRLPDKKK